MRGRRERKRIQWKDIKKKCEWIKNEAWIREKTYEFCFISFYARD